MCRCHKHFMPLVKAVGGAWHEKSDQSVCKHNASCSCVQVFLTGMQLNSQWEESLHIVGTRHTAASLQFWRFPDRSSHLCGRLKDIF